jgi:8-oxo-dGTP pyrophosphatase MutT (NUDIX family)
VDVTGKEVVRAAGGVVTRPAPDGGIEVLVVHRPRYDDWSLPKGKAEPGEHDEDTAVREVEEETGYRCTLGTELPPVHYQDRHGRPKQVRFWHMSVTSENEGKPREDPEFVPNDEVDEVRWISPTAAATLLSYDADRRTVCSLGGADAPPPS